MNKSPAITAREIDGDDMVHIHLPKPLHGWREFIGEVGIIVIGVLIALGAESLIERWHWHEQTEHTREGIKVELYSSAINSWERLAVADCLQAQLVRLADALDKSDGNWIGMPMVRHNTLSSMPAHIAPAFAPPSRYYLSDTWKNAIATGSLNHMSGKEVGSYSETFGSVEIMNETQNVEAIAATKLSPLSSNRRLNDRDRSDMIANIAEVDRASTLMTIISGELLSSVRKLHLGFDRSAVAKDRADILHLQHAYRGTCVRDLPLDLG